jgi:hypothetical protein
MNNEQSSISIINRSSTSLTGENAQALPIKLVDSNLRKVRIEYFLFGFIFTVVMLTLFTIWAKRNVVVVDISGKSPDYQEYRLN